MPRRLVHRHALTPWKQDEGAAGAILVAAYCHLVFWGCSTSQGCIGRSQGGETGSKRFAQHRDRAWLEEWLASCRVKELVLWEGGTDDERLEWLVQRTKDKPLFHHSGTRVSPQDVFAESLSS